MEFQFRKPVEYADSISLRRQKKWNPIIAAFMNDQLEELKEINRTGTRGRIFAELVKNMLDILQIPSKPEPIFDHIEPNKWYLDFSLKYDDIKIRTHEFYNPDYLFNDGTWLEVTLSENTAYKKLFRYGHQAPLLNVLWLDEDKGLHKKVCKNVEFPNAKVLNIKEYFSKLRKTTQGKDLIKRFQKLKNLKGIIG
ncbi:MAG: hypothetical protein ABR513_06640 [Desulfotignum sp.]